MPLRPHNPPLTTPTPDPTSLTTDALNREIAQAKEVVATRFEGIERALADQKEFLFATINERGKCVQVQFADRDIRVEQTARDSKAALDAALAAAKEAGQKQAAFFAESVLKSENATQKQIDLIGQTMQGASLGLNDKIDSLKERITRLEGEDKGERAAVVTQQTSNMSLVSVIGLIIGSLIGIGGLIAALVGR